MEAKVKDRPMAPYFIFSIHPPGEDMIPPHSLFPPLDAWPAARRRAAVMAALSKHPGGTT